MWDNTIEGLGNSDRLNPLVEVDNLALHWSLAAVDCNAYARMTVARTGNFVLPSRATFVSLGSW